MCTAYNMYYKFKNSYSLYNLYNLYKHYLLLNTLFRKKFLFLKIKFKNFVNYFFSSYFSNIKLKFLKLKIFVHIYNYLKNIIKKKFQYTKI